MVHKQNKAVLEFISNLIKEDRLSVAQKIGEGTIACLSEETASGTVLQAFNFHEIPENFRHDFEDKAKGETIGRFKVVAVYELWPTVKKPKSVSKQLFN